jgi:hypothetical protein
VSLDDIYLRPNHTRSNHGSTELRKQLADLHRTVAAQGELLKRLIDELENPSRPSSRASAQQNDIGTALNRGRG